MKDFLRSAGLASCQHVLLHSSFKRIKGAFPGITIPDLIQTLQDMLTPKGSLIMPSFTYNYAIFWGAADAFNRYKTPGRTGAVTEVFRNTTGTVRTSSPSHSFLLSGKIKEYIYADNSPSSPLGKGSVLEWLAQTPDSFILHLGTDFTSNTFCHYIEIVAGLPWIGKFPPPSLGIKKAGLSVNGEQKLSQIPGCSLAFINFQNYLLDKNLIAPVEKGTLKAYFVPVDLLLLEGNKFFKNNPHLLLCPEGSCNDCDAKRRYLKNYEKI